MMNAYWIVGVAGEIFLQIAADLAQRFPVASSRSKGNLAFQESVEMERLPNLVGRIEGHGIERLKKNPSD